MQAGSLPRPVPLPISPHLRQSHVLKMINEEGQEINRQAWPPRNTGGARRPNDYLTKIGKDTAKKVAWPPRYNSEGINEEYLSEQQQQYQSLGQNQISDNMDQQMMSQQYEQQVASSQSGYNVLNQSYQVQQYQYEQQYGGYSQSMPITTNNQQQIEQTLKFNHDMPGQQFQIPIQRMQTESVQQESSQSSGLQFQIPIQRMQTKSEQQESNQSTGQQFQIPIQQIKTESVVTSSQSTGQQFQIPIQTPAHGQMLSQQEQFLAQSYNQNQPQGQFQQSKSQGQPRSGGLSTSSNAPNAEMVKEWPPKNDGPNLTTTYPSGFKLKDELSMSQPEQEVVTSQPAFKITQPLKMRGDTKWPPRKSGDEVMTQEEVREFVKPKKQTRDYSEFFAQNALPNSYTGYRAPPGTQHHGLDEETE